jgi:hypothetical protein
LRVVNLNLKFKKEMFPNCKPIPNCLNFSSWSA